MHGPDDMPELSPEGASCRSHESRPAFCVCPRCRAHVCGMCWFPEHGRCHRCVVSAPEELGEPLAFERADGSFAARFFATLASALAPGRSAVSFAFGSYRRALVFFTATFVPFALLRGVIPYTHLVEFGPGPFAVHLKRPAPAAEVALDVLRAAGISFLEIFAVFLALLLCYRSLARAFGRDTSGEIATRLVLYRAFLLPLGAFLPTRMGSDVFLLPDGLVFTLSLWTLPRLELSLVIGLLLSVVPAVLVFVSLRNVARLVLGADALAAFLLALVPWTLSVAVQGLVHFALQPLLPAITVQ